MNEKTVYQINHAGLFIGNVIADESPLEPSVFLIPAGCVEIAPPFTWPEDKWPRFTGLDWELINKPKVEEPKAAAEKLAEFLAQNPDVLQLIQKT